MVFHREQQRRRSWITQLRALTQTIDDSDTDAAMAERRRERRRWIALAVLCLGQLMMVLDATIVNVALPSIQHDLHFTQGNLTWVINGYLITFGGFLLLAGRLGDLVGRKRVFLVGPRAVHGRLGAVRRSPRTRRC